ncbi:hypothetical protein QYE76_061951 [Lolium multiflorum]|uniref:F-box domain-containing protein n=1 Tax=Lolium multiflorum TaxID=4521 RepID=A0AAD8W569_LOLMU|nr:hypothetical protein QYE76_061951 [Lolium multiflorum]
MARKQRVGGEDRLSALPDATLTHILSHFHTDQAVRTSELSRRWRRVFTAVPVVDIGAAPQRTICPVTVNHMVTSRKSLISGAPKMDSVAHGSCAIETSPQK